MKRCIASSYSGEPRGAYQGVEGGGLRVRVELQQVVSSDDLLRYMLLQQSPCRWRETKLRHAALGSQERSVSQSRADSCRVMG